MYLRVHELVAPGAPSLPPPGGLNAVTPRSETVLSLFQRVSGHVGGAGGHSRMHKGGVQLPGRVQQAQGLWRRSLRGESVPEPLPAERLPGLPLPRMMSCICLWPGEDCLTGSAALACRRM